jgi:hypothetical protein
LNPIRAGLVADSKSLDQNSYSGHSHLIGRFKSGFQDTETALSMLKAAGEKLERKYLLQAEGHHFGKVVSRVCEVFGLTRREVISWSKQRKRAIARSVLAYWSVRELGMTTCAVAEKLGLSSSAASRCVQRGERIVARDRLIL